MIAGLTSKFTSMRTIKLLIISLFAVQCMSAQNVLLVVKVNGLIIAKTINKELKPGLEISFNEKFVYKTPAATASFIDPKSGKIFQLNVKKNIYLPDIEVFEDRGNTQESLFSFFSDTILYFKKIAVTLPSNLMEKFSKQEYVLRILINAQKVSMSFNQSDNLFVLQRDTMQKLEPGHYESQLCSVKKDDGTSNVLSNFLLIIPETDRLINECSIIKKNTPAPLVEKNIYEFIRINYGKISDSDLSVILKSIR